MQNYKINVSWSKDDNAYIAAVTELPGCMADGATESEAIENAKVIIEEWIETAKKLGRRLKSCVDK